MVNSMLYFTTIKKKVQSGIDSLGTQESKAADMWQGLQFSDLDLPFPPSPDHDLVNFPMEKCLVACHEFSDRC